MSDRDDIIERLDQLDRKVDAVIVQTTETNGRVTELERISGKLTADTINMRRTIFGNEKHGLKSDGGLVGWVRQTRRDIRIAGAIIGVVAPAVWIFLDRVTRVWFG